MYLRPLILREHYYSPIEAEIKRLFDELLYRPLTEACCTPFSELQNDNNPLTAAIASGKVWFEDGKFRGEFSSTISKELRRIGAQYNAHSRTWSLDRQFLPPEISFAIVRSGSIYENMRRRFVRKLDEIRPDSVPEHSHTTDEYGRTIGSLEANFQSIIAPIPTIEIKPNLTKGQADFIAREWGQNLDLYIKDWIAEDIVKLRDDVQVHGLAGGRAEGLVDMLQKNYGTSRAKAKFLARQETSLLMSKFHESRFKQIGVTQYKWSGVNDARERPDHKRLNGKIFSWDSPPITNLETGARNHPGEDYGCRCTAIPWLP